MHVFISHVLVSSKDLRMNAHVHSNIKSNWHLGMLFSDSRVKEDLVREVRQEVVDPVEEILPKTEMTICTAKCVLVTGGNVRKT